MTVSSYDSINTGLAPEGAHSQAIGRSRGDSSTKISLIVDTLGNLARFVLLPVHRHDLIGAPPPARRCRVRGDDTDKAYDSNDLRAQVQARGVIAVIPPNAYRVEAIDYDPEMYKWRHLMENFFCKLKYFRRIAMRFEKTDVSYAAMIYSVTEVLQSGLNIVEYVPLSSYLPRLPQEALLCRRLWTSQRL